MRLALYQGAPRRGDIAGNLATIRTVLSAAAGDGVDLVVFPECFLAGYYNPDRVASLAVCCSTCPNVASAPLLDGALSTGEGILVAPAANETDSIITNSSEDRWSSTGSGVSDE